MTRRAIRAFLWLELLCSAAAGGQFTTAIGGTYPASVAAIATDSSGNTYVVSNGQVAGTPDFVNAAISPQAHVFVTKLDANGNVLFTDTLAGQGVDQGAAIAVDSAGNIYVAGMTTSADFPMSHALQAQMFPANRISGLPVGSGFITKLSIDGATILYSTYFGGTLGQSAISGLAVDATGNLYLTGYTQATDFPHTAGMPFGTLAESPASPGAILASISAAGDKILYSGAIPMVPPCNQLGATCIAHNNAWEGIGIALDAAGNAYIGGNAGNAADLPTTAGVLAPNGLGAFVAKVKAGGTGLSYLTYLGSGQTGNPAPYNSPLTTLSAIAVDAAGNAYLGGQTSDPNFPTTAGSYQSTYPNLAVTGFLAKLNPAGSAVVWGSFFDIPQSIAVDGAGNVWASGLVTSLPNQNGWTTGTEYLSALNASGSSLLYSALYPYGLVSQSIAVDPSGLIHAAGPGGFVSAIDPLSKPAPTISYFGNAAGSAATARLAPGEVIAIYGPGIGPSTSAVAAPKDGLYPTTLGGVEVSVNDVKMPLLYAGGNQINAVVPMELTINSAAVVRLTNGSLVSSFPVWIVSSAPMAFPGLMNQDWSMNSRTNPAKSGSVVTFYATGWQPTFFPLADGQVQITAADACQGNCVASADDIGGPIGGNTRIAATVLYGGDAVGIVAGVTQLNVQLGSLPPASGTVCLHLNVQGPSLAAVAGPAVFSNVCVAP